MLRSTIAAAAITVAAVSCADAYGFAGFGKNRPRLGRCVAGEREVALSVYNLPGSQVSISTRQHPVYFDANAHACASNMPDGFPKGKRVELRNPRKGGTSYCIINDTLPKKEAWAVGVRLDATPRVFKELGPLGPGGREESGWVCAR